MKILVLNSGSSTIKYQLFKMDKQLTLVRGVVDRIGLRGAYLKQTRQEDGQEVSLSGEILDHQQAIEYILAVLTDKERGVLDSKEEIEAVGHRVVHGGEKFTASVRIDPEVLHQLHRFADLAPLHNPHNLKGIEAGRQLIPHAINVAVFDTAFHHTLPKHAYLYGLPYMLYRRYGIRRYGFHGLSHRFVSERFQELTQVDHRPLRLVTIHLGNGCSMAAIHDGQSVDTTMGFTPVEGLLMGSRSGDVDPAVILHIMGREEISRREAIALLNKHSGLLGISGVSSDMREVLAEMAEGNTRAELAIQVFAYRIKKYIGAFASVLGGLDGVAFTGGIGENASLIRKMAVNELEFLGLALDEKKNEQDGTEQRISTDDSPCEIWVIPTNEEWIIARDTFKLASEEDATA
ncbi:MAG: acetate kinase [Fidelibacterota bacterium]|nr:MAG: acetate kinase [Candidatus Neomarinimicrobiota bacterium]